ncbi:actin nucleation-promoting factor WASL [Chironomus tepperi]|uniref:actin nucleation-promoting factor WASL n=1 Tax=Chironomus tepperi TaxID=113505 RepID=UPI00391F3824
MSSENRNSVKLSKASTYLSGEENELVFRLLGRRCQSQCTTVAQIYQTETPHTRWLKRYTGALCFVKDNSKRSYYARMFCLIKHEMVWEQEMYDTIEINKVKPYLLTFEGQDGMVALNFAFEDEAEAFLSTAINTVQSRNRRREERRSRVRKEPPARPPPITSNALSDEPVILRNPTNLTKITPNQFQPPYTQQPQNLGNLKTKKREVKKITKEDIGLPSNFKHVTHVGWNAKSGFDLSGEDEALKPFLQKAGVSENQLKDRRTRDFIYDFIQSNNVEEIVRKETKKPDAPSIPIRNPQNNGEKPTHRLAPPPPPPVQRDYQQNHRDVSHKNQAPILPGPPIVRNISSNKPTSNTAPQAPPPPPPPPQINMPPPPPPMKESIALPIIPDARNALMESIRKGALLKKIDASSTASNSSGDSRSDLMSEIRGGIELRPVSDRSNNQANRSSDGNGTDALADALRRALEQRKTAINGSSSSESENENSDDGEWSD